MNYLEAHERVWKRIDKRSPVECWEWQGAINSHGYGTIRQRCVSRGAHVVALESTGVVVPKGMQVCHHCDNRRCCNPQHLFVGTLQDNMADRDAKGRQARGVRIPRARLTEHSVSLIRLLLDLGVPGLRLAELFGVPQPTISAIKRGVGWKHVPALEAP